MTAADIVGRLFISEVGEALGVKLDLTRRRAVATWREGRNFSVALCDAKNTWFDHSRGEGSGLIDFVSRVRGCDRKSALDWLADYAGVPLGEQTDAQAARS